MLLAYREPQEQYCSGCDWFAPSSVRRQIQRTARHNSVILTHKHTTYRIMPALLSKLLHHTRATLLGLSLPAKCATLTVTVLALHSLLVLAASARGNQQLMEQQQTLLATQWVEQIAHQTQQGLMQTDRLALLSVLRQHLQNPLLHYARIADSEQRVLVEAGEIHAGLQMFHSDIRIGNDIAGSVSIGFDSGTGLAERNALNIQLFILAAVLIGLAGALLFMGGAKLDRALQQAAAELLRPSENPAPAPYSADDSLGALLAAVHQREPELPVLHSREGNWIVLHLHWQHFQRLSQQWGKAELDRRLTRSYQAAVSLSRLYHGHLDVMRNDGVSLRFSALEGADEPLLRALCCGWLLQRLDKELGASARIGMIRSQGNRYQLAASEAALINSLAGISGSGIQTQLSGDMNALLDQWVDRNAGGLELKSRYCVLLEKQLARMQVEVGRRTSDV